MKKRPNAARRTAALAGWRTKRRHERERSERARRGATTRAENRELEAIEKLLEEEFETLKEAREALKEEEENEQLYEFVVSFTYRSGRSFDVIVTAYDEEEAEQSAMKYLSRDEQLGKVKGWVEWNIVAVRADPVNRMAKPQLRSKSSKRKGRK